jgi:hypothetical protein
MFIEEQIKLEDELRERAFLESIGPIGRILDNDNLFLMFIGLNMAAGFSIGFIFGIFKWVLV